MEYLSEVLLFSLLLLTKLSFNPYFNGIPFGSKSEGVVKTPSSNVSILILMEYLSEENVKAMDNNLKDCFNPYFNGIPFGRGAAIDKEYRQICFNPYFNGIPFGRSKEVILEEWGLLFQSLF